MYYLILRIPDKCTKATRKAVITFKKKWTKYKLKPKFKKTKKGKFNDTIDKTGFENIGNYKQLKSAMKKK